MREALEMLMPTINFPIIIISKTKTSRSVYAKLNLPIEHNEDDFENSQRIFEYADKMDRTFQPYILDLHDGLEVEIHFGDSSIIGKLNWLPYLELGLVFLFIVFSFFGFQLIRNSEKNFIWAGMARETAHQLGTPVSSLYGWINLLRDDEMDKGEIIKSMEIDINRLSDISSRFHKIGSIPHLNEINLYDLLSDLTQYMRTRLPSSSTIKISYVCDTKTKINAEPILLSWSIENLIKNAIDACDSKTGEIKIVVLNDTKHTIIRVIDSGKGVLGKNQKNVFKPGYSTRNRGWGLGLSLTKRIIEEIHHGKIVLESSRQGETIFKIRL